VTAESRPRSRRGDEGLRLAAATPTVAVATCGRPAALERCLDALLTGAELPAEIVVVDQSSDGRAREIVESRGVAAVTMVYIAQERRGLSASRNAAFARAKSQVVAFTDDDCVPSPQWFAALRAGFARTPGASSITGPMLPLGPAREGFEAVSSRTSTRREEYTRTLAPWHAGTGANMALRREWLERVGGYDERLGVGSPGEAGEDVDLVYRLLRAGGRVVYEPDAIVYHERQPLDRRRASRSSYGRGIGTFVGLHLRDGDVRGLGVLARWGVLRAQLAGEALLSRRWSALADEGLVVRGTVQGLAHGLREARGPRRSP
jgi:GT2 family glycosyltransferase